MIIVFKNDIRRFRIAIDACTNKIIYSESNKKMESVIDWVFVLHPRNYAFSSKYNCFNIL